MFEAVSSDDDDFAAFYRREYVTMARLAGLLTGSNLINEDLAQEAFLAIRARFDQLDNPHSYLRQAIVNRCRSWQRDQHRQQRRLRVLASGTSGASPLGADELADVIERLPYRQRVVVVARYWAGWSELEIAYALGCRPGTVKSLSSRALTRIRTQIEEGAS